MHHALVGERDARDIGGHVGKNKAHAFASQFSSSCARIASSRKSPREEVDTGNGAISSRSSAITRPPFIRSATTCDQPPGVAPRSTTSPGRISLSPVVDFHQLEGRTRTPSRGLRLLDVRIGHVSQPCLAALVRAIQ